jgi:hypothetical protein
MEALVKAPQTTTESSQSTIRGEAALPQSAKINPNSYFSIDTQEIMNMLGPAIADIEVASIAGRFLEADDAIKYDSVKPESKLPAHSLEVNQSSYFTYDDSVATHEALTLLGPAVTDDEVSGYMAHLLA